MHNPAYRAHVTSTPHGIRRFYHAGFGAWYVNSKREI